MRKLNEIIRELRQDNDLNQKKIAELLNTTQQVYSRYETGENELPIHHLITLAKFYKTSTDFLLGLTNERNPHSND
ncbi:MAG: transcriptional regulator [Clostridiales bacterium GWC2_40_7]|nr:MAG: transcriptional regulator [Clostridiales bacterium GWC2_40_7]